MHACLGVVLDVFELPLEQIYAKHTLTFIYIVHTRQNETKH